MTSQKICEANVSFWNGGNPPPCSPAGTCSVVATVFWFCAMINASPERQGRPVTGSQREQQQQRDQQREDAHRLGHREPEDQIAELALRGGRIAQSGGQVMTENRSDADARATHADTGNARTNVFCGDWIHEEAPFGLPEPSGPDESHR